MTIVRASPDDLVGPWAFTPSQPSLRVRVLRAGLKRSGVAPPPASETIRRPTPARRWNVLFLYLPSGRIDSDQAQIIARMRSLSGRFMIVAASASPDTLPEQIDIADALIWKALDGFDMSGYGLALASLAAGSPGSLVYLQNDSVFGPFGDMDALIENAPFDVTGFIGSPQIENHLSSFAFVFRNFGADAQSALRPVLSDRWATNSSLAAVLLQETRLARAAAKYGQVGSYWFLPTGPEEPSLYDFTLRRLKLRAKRQAITDVRGDVLLSWPVEMLDRGFPFAKRSLFTKFADVADQPALAAALRQRGWDI